MIKSYFKTAIRNLLKHRGLSLLNVLGLASALTICMLILQFVSYEQSFDAFHKDSDQIKRVRIDVLEGSSEKFKTAGTPFPFGPALQENLPEVSAYARARQLPNLIMKYGDTKFYESDAAFVDSTLLKLFSYEILSGSVGALKDPSKMAISESAAKKYFGAESPLGKVIEVNSPYGKFPLEVGVVYRDMPANSYFNYNFMLSIIAFSGDANSWAQHLSYHLYVKLNQGADKAALLAKGQRLLDDRSQEGLKEANLKFRMVVQDLPDVYLNSDELLADHGSHGIGENSQFLIILAICVLLVGWFNYVNLSFAKALEREKEVNIRKFLGAHKHQLIIQFFAESFIVNFIALLLAVGLSLLISSQLDYFADGSFMIFLQSGLAVTLAIVLIVGSAMSGFFPSLFFSSFSPIATLTSRQKMSGTGQNVRRVLLFLQLAFSFAVMTFLYTSYQQIEMMRNSDLGFNEEQMLIVKSPTVVGYVATEEVASYESFKDQLLSRADVSGIGNTVYLPTENKAMTLEARRTPEDEMLNVFGLRVDPNFQNTFGIQMIAGRNFSEQIEREAENVVINDRMRMQLGFGTAAEALDQRIFVDGEAKRVIGVTANFMHRPVKRAQEPLIMIPVYATQGYLAIRISGDDLLATNRAIRGIWETSFPDDPFFSFYLEDFVADQLYAENQFISLLLALTVFAMLITFLGILGLSLIAVREKIKELGVRLVLGATTFNIIKVLSRTTVIILFISALVAVPLTYLGISEWLNNFPNRIDVQIAYFILPFLGMFFILSAIVTFVGYKVIHSNPISSLRTE